MEPLVSVIVPTFRRHELLLNRCLPSLFNQIYKNIEIVVISDGPDEWLNNYFAEKKYPNLRYFELSHNWGLCGGWVKHFASFVVRGELVGYLDDDDEYLSNHVSDLVALQQTQNKDFVYSMMFGWSKDKEIIAVGNGVPSFMAIGTPMILHKYELFKTANWSPKPGSYDEDWRLISQWLANGATYDFNNKVTILLRGATLALYETLKAMQGCSSFYLDSKRFAEIMANPMIFDFDEIKDIIYRSTFNYYGMHVPLPYVQQQRVYHGGTVPNIIHFTWTGSVLPKKYVENICRFRDNNPTYSIMLWVDDDNLSPIDGVNIRIIDIDKLVNAEIYKRLNGVSVKNDLLRMELIYAFGGIYSDIDAVSVKSFGDAFKKPFLAYEPHSWRDINSSILGFPKSDEFLKFCLYNLGEHFKWIAGNKPDWFDPTPGNVLKLCSGVYLMMCLLAFEDIPDIQFINQDYLIQNTGYGYVHQTMDGINSDGWIHKLSQIKTLYEV